MKPIAELINVSREFDSGRITALRSVSLAIGEGESVAVVGPSGSGKSTLLNLICGLDRPSSGEVRFDGRQVAGRSAWARIRAKDVGIVFQDFCLIPTLSARQNVEVAMTDGGDGIRRRRALEMLDTVGMADRADNIPAELSGGERQRVGIVRALVNRPRLVLADEPTGSLDQAAGQSVLALLLDMRVRFASALLIVTHNPDVETRCERRVSLRDGHMVSQRIAAGSF